MAKWTCIKTVFKYTDHILRCICESCKNNVHSPAEANIIQSAETGTTSNKGLNVAQYCQSHEWQYMCRCSVLTDRPPPIILQGPVNQTLAVDGTALLKCKATGDPLPVISWLKEGFTFLGRDPRTSIQDQGTLQIKTLRVSDKNKATVTSSMWLIWSWQCALGSSTILLFSDFKVNLVVSSTMQLSPRTNLIILFFVIMLWRGKRRAFLTTDTATKKSNSKNRIDV